MLLPVVSPVLLRGRSATLLVALFWGIASACGARGLTAGDAASTGFDASMAPDALDQARSDRRDDGAADAPGAVCATLTSSSDLPGVRLSWLDAPCDFSQAEIALGVGLPFILQVDADLPAVNSVAHSCIEQRDASGLFNFVNIEGMGNRYCECDDTTCPPQPALYLPLKAGTYNLSALWHGENLGMGNDGNPFPPGVYNVSVTSLGGWSDGANFMQFTVQATRQIQIR